MKRYHVNGAAAFDLLQAISQRRNIVQRR